MTNLKGSNYEIEDSKPNLLSEINRCLRSVCGQGNTLRYALSLHVFSNLLNFWTLYEALLCPLLYCASTTLVMKHKLVPAPMSGITYLLTNQRLSKP